MKYKVLDERKIDKHVLANEGDIVYDLTGSDFGCSSQDTMYTQKVHISVTKNPDGSYPFFTIPTTSLLGIPE